MTDINTSRFKARANGGGGRRFRADFASKNEGKWGKTRSKEWIWIPGETKRKVAVAPKPKPTGKGIKEYKAKTFKKVGG